MHDVTESDGAAPQRCVHDANVALLNPARGCTACACAALLPAWRSALWLQLGPRICEVYMVRVFYWSLSSKSRA